MFISNLRQALRAGLLAAFVLPFSSLAADAPADYQWSSYLATAQTLEIRLIDGSIRVEPSDGTLVEVSAWKTGWRPDPATVQIETVEHEGGLLICFVYPSPRADRPNRCTVDNANNNVSLTNPDLKVDFVARIPAGVKFRGYAVNGSIDLNVKDNPATADVVNGRVTAATQAPLQAHAVNGSIEATLGDVPGKSALGVINGSVQATLSSSANAVVHGQIVLGTITSEFPLTIRHFLVGSAVDGVLGAGDGELQINAVTGKIGLRRATEQ